MSLVGSTPPPEGQIYYLARTGTHTRTHAHSCRYAHTHGSLAPVLCARHVKVLGIPMLGESFPPGALLAASFPTSPGPGGTASRPASSGAQWQEW